MKYDPQSDRLQQRIDAALKSTGGATPPEGLEGRILTRLAAARTAEPQFSWPGRRPRYALATLGFAAAGLMCAVIVVGSVEHGRATRADHVPAPPVLVLPGQGMGAASAIHTAAPASAPLAAGPNEHGRAMHPMSHARAHLPAHAHKLHGLAVPAPTPPQ